MRMVSIGINIFYLLSIGCYSFASKAIFPLGLRFVTKTMRLRASSPRRVGTSRLLGCSMLYLPAGNAFRSMMKPKQTVVVINLGAAADCPVAKRRGHPEKNKPDAEKDYSEVRTGNCMHTIAHIAASKSINLCQERHSFKHHHSKKTHED